MNVYRARYRDDLLFVLVLLLPPVFVGAHYVGSGAAELAHLSRAWFKSERSIRPTPAVVVPGPIASVPDGRARSPGGAGMC
jgi:hypothetical protein